MREAPGGRDDRVERRVAVTGIGVTCSLGRGAREVWEALAQGRRGFGPVTLFDTRDLLNAPVAQAPEIKAEPRPAAAGPPHAPPRASRLTRGMVASRLARGMVASRLTRSILASRLTRLLSAAADEAIGHAALRGSARLSGFGISLGNSNGGMLEAESWYEREIAERAWEGTAGSRGRRTISASPALKLPPSASTDAIAARFGLRGPRLTNATACSSSAGAIAAAAERIRDGDVEGMIAGGGDPLCRLTYSGFGALRLMDPAGCRPFEAGRKGLTLGEGAGILVLEEWNSARARGARPLAELLDHGASCDAHHMTSCHPEGRGMEAAMVEALARSGVAPHEVGYVNAHGTATPVNDAAEGKAIARVFEGASRPAVSSTKSMHGHLLGGGGAVEAVAVVLALLHGLLPPTAGIEQPDESLRLDLVGKTARPAAVRYALSNSFGFGGGNVVLLFASTRDAA